MNNISLTDKYLNLVGNRELYPPLNNYSPFIQGSEYNINKYSNGWYVNASSDMLILYKKGFSQVWLINSEFENYSRYVLAEYISDRKKFNYRIDSFYKNFKKVDEIYNEFTYKKISEMKESDLLSLMQKARDLIWSSNAMVWFSIIFDKKTCGDVLKNLDYNLSSAELDDIWEKASIPVFKSFDRQQKDYFFKLMESKTPKNQLIEMCQYFYADYYSVKSFKEVKKKLLSQYKKYFDNPSLIKHDKKEEDKKFESLNKNFKSWISSLPKNKREIAEYIQLIMMIRDHRKNFFNKGLTVAYRVAERIFDLVDVSKKHIPAYTMHELLKGSEYLKKNADNLANREKGFVLLIPSSSELEMENMLIDEEVKKVNDFYIKDMDRSSNDELKGNIGSKGSAKGVVRVVLDINSNHGFREGEILVTGMTRPEYVPLMKKAAAIITDEGGITCHAAIVSRELGKPCIIGTKFATKILNSGDEVLVDADKGVVRILK